MQPPTAVAVKGVSELGKSKPARPDQCSGQTAPPRRLLLAGRVRARVHDIFTDHDLLPTFATDILTTARWLPSTPEHSRLRATPGLPWASYLPASQQPGRHWMGHLVFGDVNRRTEMLRGLAESLIELQDRHPLRVAIDGITASGKTTLGNELAAVITDLGRPVIRIRMDDFHHRREHRYRQGRDSARGYYEDAYDFDSLEQYVLTPLGPNGNRAFKRRIIDLETDTPIHAPVELAAADSILIVDGSFMQRHHRASWDVVVFVNTSFNEALRRGITRDAAQFGGRAEAAKRYADRYHAASRMYIDEIDPIRTSDVIIDDHPSSPRLYRTFS